MELPLKSVLKLHLDTHYNTIKSDVEYTKDKTEENEQYRTKDYTNSSTTAVGSI